MDGQGVDPRFDAFRGGRLPVALEPVRGQQVLDPLAGASRSDAGVEVDLFGPELFKKGLGLVGGLAGKNGDHPAGALVPRDDLEPEGAFGRLFVEPLRFGGRDDEEPGLGRSRAAEGIERQGDVPEGLEEFGFAVEMLELGRQGVPLGFEPLQLVEDADVAAGERPGPGLQRKLRLRAEEPFQARCLVHGGEHVEGVLEPGEGAVGLGGVDRPPAQIDPFELRLLEVDEPGFLKGRQEPGLPPGVDENVDLGNGRDGHGLDRASL